MDCPYRWCSQQVEVVPAPRYPGTHRPDSELIKEHLIQHLVLSGTCPASNLYVPLDVDSYTHLRALETQDRARISELTPIKPSQASRPGTSRPLRQPRREGREPEDDSPAWALGGREDEDSGHTEFAIKPPRPPLGVQGQEVGRHVASVDEVISILQTAALRGGEAIASVQEAQNAFDNAIPALEQAINSVATVRGNATSQLLNDCLGALSQAQQEVLSQHAKMEEIKSVIAAAQEMAETYVSALLA